MSLADARAAFRALLIQGGSPVIQAGVNAGNVAFQRGPLGVSAGTKMVILSRSGGAPEPQYDRDEATITCRCYGGSQNPVDCAAVAAAVKDTVRANYNRANEHGTITHCTVISEVDSFDPDLENVPITMVVVDVSVTNKTAQAEEEE
jgi:hypothetical protein